MLITLLFIALGIIVYTYIGYGVILVALTRIRRRPLTKGNASSELPEITHVITAYNEEEVIEEKIRNCFMIDYPFDKIHTVIVTDGSDDRTVDIIKKYPRIHLMHEQQRGGKLSALNRAMAEVKTELTFLSDANSELSQDAFKQMVKHFSDKQVGAVAGEKVVKAQSEDHSASKGEGIYWKYESFLKKLDSNLHSVVGAAGELFAIRTSLFKSPKPDTLIEDFAITVEIAAQGFRVIYEPEATASECGSMDIGEEMKRKVRIAAGGLQASWRMVRFLNPFRYGIFSFQLLSHRVLRWTLAPLSLLVVFFVSAILAKESTFYQVIFGIQILFYMASFIGYYLEMYQVKLKIFLIPFYFTFMNVCVYLGLFRLVKGNIGVVWDKAKRAQ